MQVYFSTIIENRNEKINLKVSVQDALPPHVHIHVPTYTFKHDCPSSYSIETCAWSGKARALLDSRILVTVQRPNEVSKTGGNLLHTLGYIQSDYELCALCNLTLTYTGKKLLSLLFKNYF
jgi:hypothetical protein